MQLTLERGGKFEATAMQESANRCGRTGYMEYSYHVRIEATDRSLSPEGFIMENSRIQTYFEKRYAESGPYPAVSCEVMAANAARGIGRKLLAEGISVTSVACTISGSNATKLQAVWHAASEAQTKRPRPPMAVRF